MNYPILALTSLRNAPFERAAARKEQAANKLAVSRASFDGNINGMCMGIAASGGILFTAEPAHVMFYMFALYTVLMFGDILNKWRRKREARRLATEA